MDCIETPKSRAFFLSGSKSLLLTQWDVETNASKYISTKFIELSLDKNLTFAESLSQSMLEYIKNNAKSHPFYWSPFILAGNGNISLN